MTDARLRGEWVGKIKFDNLSDTAWRVFTTGLMWSAEQGTDGRIPARYMKTLHPDGEKQAAVREIAQAGIWEINDAGARFIDWDGALGQSTALQVETAKAAARERQRAYRERERAKQAKAIGFTDTTTDALSALPTTGDVTRDVTSPVTGDVGKGKGKGAGDHEVMKASENFIERCSVCETSDSPHEWDSMRRCRDCQKVNASTGEVDDWWTAPIPDSDSTSTSSSSNQCRICSQQVASLDAWGLCSKVTAPHVAARKERVAA